MITQYCLLFHNRNRVGKAFMVFSMPKIYVSTFIARFGSIYVLKSCDIV